VSAAAGEIEHGRRAPPRLFIAGEWWDANDGAPLRVVDPTTGMSLAEVAGGGPRDVDAAVGAARTALASAGWSRMDAADRGHLLWRLADRLEANADALTRIEVCNTGKPLREARADVRDVVNTFRYYAGWAGKLHGETIPVRGAYLNYTLREPVGVVGAIVPWNFPLQLAAWKVAPALACGNAVVLKPAEQTPLTALELAAHAAEAGFPPGVFNVVPGTGDIAGAALVRHPGVDAIAFTGSTTVGRTIVRTAAETLKRVSLELGGKSANLVFEDADLDAAARGSANAIFYNAGQCCTAGSRLLVHEAAKDALVERILQRARTLVPGPAFDPQRRLGPLISEAQLERVLGYVARGRAVFDAVAPDATIAQEEIFGPVLSVMTFADEDEAVDRANRTAYGLAAGLWTRDVRRAHRVARRLQAGTVWINTWNVLDPASPFGGRRASGHGPDLGEAALDHYTQVKSIWVNLS
jgi:aldehyde dehydrogenase (NAD+)